MSGPSEARSRQPRGGRIDATVCLTAGLCQNKSEMFLLAVKLVLYDSNIFVAIFFSIQQAVLPFLLPTALESQTASEAEQMVETNLPAAP